MYTLYCCPKVLQGLDICNNKFSIKSLSRSFSFEFFFDSNFSIKLGYQLQNILSMRIHSGSIIYHCDYKTVSKHSLNIHMRIHSGSI